MVSSRSNGSADILVTFQPTMVNGWHIGISGEAGELLDAVKKYAVYNKSIR